MDLDDRHFYCCGECQGLFTTLSSLSKHKKLCTGAKDLNNDERYYAYHSSYLKQLLQCCTNCNHNETCPILTSTPENKTVPFCKKTSSKRRKSVKIRGEQCSGVQGQENENPTPKRKRLYVDSKSKDVQVSRKSTITSSDLKKVQGDTPPTEASTKSEGIPLVLNDGRELPCPEEFHESDTSPIKSPKINSTAISKLNVAGKETKVVSPDSKKVVSPDSNINMKTEPEEKGGSGSSESNKSYETEKDVDEKIGSTCNLNVFESVKKYSVNNSQKVPHQESGGCRFVCPVCDWKTVHIGFFTRHLNTHTDKDINGKWECRKCDFKCENPDGLKQHMLKNHVVKPKVNPPRGESERDSTLELDPKDAETMKQFRVSIGTDGKKFYKCSVCEWKTLHCGFLVRHLRTHNGIDPGSRWSCSDCDFTCVTNAELKLHNKKHKKPFMCEYCSKRFGANQELLRHVQQHTGEKPYECSQCDYKCRQPKNLLEHQRKHTGERLKCEVEGCSFTTLYGWALKGHCDSKHLCIKRFSCPDCSYQTSDSGSMVRHKRLHTGEKNYKCSQCNFRAVVKHDIVKHMRKHTKEKVYFCDQCSFGTSHSSCLRLHIMNHLGIKPWQCVLCGYNSLTRGKVIRHLKQTHQGNLPMSISEAVVNLGLKLDINISDYRKTKGSQEKVVYDIQEVPDFDHLEEVEVIVHEGGEEKLVQMSTEDGTVSQLAQIPGIQIQQLGASHLQDLEGQTIIIPMSTDQTQANGDSLICVQSTDDVANTQLALVPENVETSQQRTILLSTEDGEIIPNQTITFVTQPPDPTEKGESHLSDLVTVQTAEESEVNQVIENVSEGQSEAGVCAGGTREASEHQETVIYTAQLSDDTVLLDGQEVEVVWHIDAEDA